jgi:hypothetical protein
MKRTYLALAALAAGGAGLLSGFSPLVQAAGLFEARPVDGDRFAVLARAVGRDDWTLLVLEQIRPQPLCWQSRADGLVDPRLNRFDFTGICGRYIDSNGYSLRFADGRQDADGGSRLRLRLEQVGSELQLQAASADLAGVVVVGRAAIPARLRDAFVAIRLEPGWALQRRTYGSQTLNHIYFANGASAGDLLARASSPPDGTRLASGRAVPQLAPPPPPPPALAPRQATRQAPMVGATSWRQAPPANPAVNLETLSQESMGGEGRAIALQVIPFQE